MFKFCTSTLESWLYLDIAVVRPNIVAVDVLLTDLVRPAAGGGQPHLALPGVEVGVVLPHLPRLLHLDGLDAAALEPGLGPVPRPRHGGLRPGPVAPQVRHQPRLHVGLDLLSEDVGNDAAHHQDAQQEDGHCRVDHHQALHLLVRTEHAKDAVGYA